MTASLKDALFLLKDDATAYGKEFRELADKLSPHIAAYAKAWDSIQTASHKDLRAAALAMVILNA